MLILWLAAASVLRKLFVKEQVQQDVANSSQSTSVFLKTCIESRKEVLDGKFKGLDTLLLDLDSEYEAFNDLFEHCASAVEKLSLEKALEQSDLLEFYGLFKQAKVGDADDSQAPSIFDVRAKSKFQAWRENQGLTPEQAQKFYICKYASLSEENEELATKVQLLFLIL